MILLSKIRVYRSQALQELKEKLADLLNSGNNFAQLVLHKFRSVLTKNIGLNQAINIYKSTNISDPLEINYFKNTVVTSIDVLNHY